MRCQYFALISFFSISLLILNTVLKYNSSIFTTMPAVILLIIVLLPNLGGILTSRTGKIIIFQLILVIFFIYQQPPTHVYVFLEAILKFSDIVTFLIFMSVYAYIFKKSHIDNFFVELLLKVKNQYRKFVLLFVVTISSIGLSFGSNIVFGMSMPKKNKVIAGSLSRAIVLSMMLLPTTGSTAVLMLVFSELHLFQIICVMLPVFVASLFFAFLIGGNSFPSITENKKSQTKQILWLPLLVSLVVMTTLIILGLSILIAMSWSALLGFISLVNFKNSPQQLGVILTRSLRRLSPEILLFLVTGLLIWCIGNISVMHLNLILQPQLQIFVSPIMIFIIMTFCALLGLHPIAVFGLLYPLSLDLTSQIPSQVMYCCWVVSFIASLLISPVSVLTVTSSIGSGLSIRESCYPLHWRFVSVMLLFTLAYLWLCYYLIF